MSINDFINSLSNELIKNNFHYIEISKDYNSRDKSYLINIINYKDNKKYCHGFSIHEKCLNGESIFQRHKKYNSVCTANVAIINRFFRRLTLRSNSSVSIVSKDIIL